jgi:sodium-independent sulfate anion transporter 11
MVKVGPKDGAQMTAMQRAINKSLWLIGTSRNAILVVICGFIGYHFENTDAIKLTGEYQVNVICTLQPCHLSTQLL